MLVKNFYNILNKYFNFRKQEKWDNNGKQIIFKKEQVKNIYICLDLDEINVVEAINQNCNVIITHHPFFFAKKKQELKLEFKNNVYKELLKHKISVISLHTCFDKDKKFGINNYLAKKLNIEKGQTSYDNYSLLLRDANIKNIITESEKYNYLSNALIYNNNNIKNIESIFTQTILGSGACGYLVNKMKKNSLLLTGEIKWNELIVAKNKNITVINFGHNMEYAFIEASQIFLLEKFKSNEINEIFLDKFIFKGKPYSN